MKGEGQDQRIALFVDFENLVTRTGIAPETFDLQPARSPASAPSC